RKELIDDSFLVVSDCAQGASPSCSEEGVILFHASATAQPPHHHRPPQAHPATVSTTANARPAHARRCDSLRPRLSPSAQRVSPTPASGGSQEPNASQLRDSPPPASGTPTPPFDTSPDSCPLRFSNRQNRVPLTSAPSEFPR